MSKSMIENLITNYIPEIDTPSENVLCSARALESIEDNKCFGTNKEAGKLAEEAFSTQNINTYCDPKGSEYINENYTCANTKGTTNGRGCVKEPGKILECTDEKDFSTCKGSHWCEDWIFRKK